MLTVCRRLLCRVLSEFMVELQQQISCLYELANCIAVLDMLAAFAHNCTISSCGLFKFCLPGLYRKTVVQRYIKWSREVFLYSTLAA